MRDMQLRPHGCMSCCVRRAARVSLAAVLLVLDSAVDEATSVGAVPLRQGQARSMYLGMGLFQVVKAVSFLNNDCKLVRACRWITQLVVTALLCPFIQWS